MFLDGGPVLLDQKLTGMCGGFYRQLVWDDLTWRIDILSDVEGAHSLILSRQQNTAGPVPKQNGDRARTRVLPPFGFLPRRGCVRPNRPVWVRICFGLDSI